MPGGAQSTCRDLFIRTQDPAHHAASLAAVTGALEVYTAGGAEYHIAKATRLRDDILSLKP